MSFKVAKLALAVAALSAAAATQAGTFTGTGQRLDKSLPKQSYNASQVRPYEIYVPKSYVAGTPMPMVVALHGCAMEYPGNAPSDVMKEWNLDLVADREGFILVTPFLKTYDGSRASNCWGYWMDSHIHAGAGELEDIMQIAREVEKQYTIDPGKRFVTGLSAGGAMTVALSLAYPNYWRAAATAEGLPYGDAAGSVTGSPETYLDLSSLVQKARNELNKTANAKMVPILEIHSLNDEVSRVKSGEQIRDVALSVWGNGTSHSVAKQSDCAYEGIACTEKEYLNAAGEPIVITRFYNGDKGPQSGIYGGGHYWVGDDGSTDNWSYDKGPSNSEAVWSFFKRVGDDLQCSTTDNSATLKWNANPTATGYKVYVGGSLNQTVTTSTATIGSLAAETTYNFTVEVMKDATLLKSYTKACTTKKYYPPLPAPTGAACVGKDAATVTANWNAVSNAKGYKLYRVRPSTQTVNATGTSVDDGGLLRNTTYWYQVATVNQADVEGTKSGEFSCTTKDFEQPSQTANDTASGHYVAKRATTSQYLCLGGQYGYTAKFNLFKCTKGWTDSSTCQPTKCFP